MTICGLLTLLFCWKWLGNLPIFINTCEAIDLLINLFWFTTLSVAVTSFPWFWPQVIHSHHSLKLKFVLYFCSKSHQKWFPCSVLFIDLETSAIWTPSVWWRHTNHYGVTLVMRVSARTSINIQKKWKIWPGDSADKLWNKNHLYLAHISHWNCLFIDRKDNFPYNCTEWNICSVEVVWPKCRNYFHQNMLWEEKCHQY